MRDADPHQLRKHSAVGPILALIILGTCVGVAYKSLLSQEQGSSSLPLLLLAIPDLHAPDLRPNSSLGLPTMTTSQSPGEPKRASNTRPGLPVPLWSASEPPPHWAAVNWTHAPPLGDVELARSFSRPATPEAQCPWARTAAALEAGAHVDIVVIGGSLTKGVKSGCPACAWASHLGPWLARARPHWNVTVTNLGEGGYGALEWVHRDDPFFARTRADIVIVDTSVNAFFHVDATLRVSMDRLLWRLLHSPGAHAGGAPPAILYVCEFRLGCTGGGGLPLPGSLAGSPGECWTRRFWEMGGVEAAVARHYGLPVASYRDAVWPIRDAPPDDLRALWKSDDGIHPDRVAHELIADVVKYALERLLEWPRALVNEEGRQHHPLVALPVCNAKGLMGALVPATTLAQASGSCDGATRVDSLGTANPGHFERGTLGFGGAWVFGGDSGRAPGWTGVIAANSPEGSAWITFPVSFSSSGYGNPILPHIELTFLRSYTGFVSATVSLNATGCRILTPTVGKSQLSGTWLRRVTTPFTLTLGALDVRASESEDGYEELAMHKRCILSARESYALTLTLQLGRQGGNVFGGLFKLLGIRSCNLYVNS